MIRGTEYANADKYLKHDNTTIHQLFHWIFVIVVDQLMSNFGPINVLV